MTLMKSDLQASGPDTVSQRQGLYSRFKEALENLLEAFAVLQVRS